MDWEKWRQEENQRLKDAELIKEFRKQYGIKDRTPQELWGSICGILLLILVTIILGVSIWPAIVDTYHTDPNYRASMIKGVKYGVLYSVPAAICSIVYIVFRR